MATRTRVPGGAYRERWFPPLRFSTIDHLDHARRKHHVPLLLEVDVTRARALIHERKARTGEGWSFTGWVVKCLGQAVSEHRHVHALRRGGRRLILFDDVDVTVAIEREIGEGETLPLAWVVKKANAKSVAEIHDEIRAAQTRPVPPGEAQIGSTRDPRLTRAFFALPGFLRGLIWRWLMRDPFFVKDTIGTVEVTSVGTHGLGCSWGVPAGIHPLIVALGGIAWKPGVVGERIEPREYLGLTILFDHDVTDGAPVARFARRLQELMEAGWGLEGQGEG